MNWTRPVMLTFALAAIASAATAQEPGYRNRPDVGPIDGAMRRDGEVVVPRAVGPGEIAGTMPFAYRRTGVLATDAKSITFYSPGVKAPAGSPGFFVQKVNLLNAFNNPITWELWCFLPDKAGGKSASMCVTIQDFNSIGLLAAPKGGRFWPDALLANLQRTAGVAGPAPTVRVEAVEITPNPVLQYRFLKWIPKGVEVEFLVGGEVSDQFRAPFEPDGTVQLGLLDGSYLRLSKDTTDPLWARVEFVPSGAQYDPETYRQTQVH